MKSMKLGLLRSLYLLAVGMIASTVYAGQEYRRVPINSDGHPVQNMNVAGCKTAISTGATTSVVLATGKGLLYSIDTSSSASSTGVDTYVVLRDSATSNTAQSTWLIPPIVFGGIGGTHLTWTVPLRFVNGLQWQVNLATSTVTVGYTLDAD